MSPGSPPNSQSVPDGCGVSVSSLNHYVKLLQGKGSSLRLRGTQVGSSGLAAPVKHGKYLPFPDTGFLVSEMWHRHRDGLCCLAVCGPRVKQKATCLGESFLLQSMAETSMHFPPVIEKSGPHAAAYTACHGVPVRLTCCMTD